MRVICKDFKDIEIVFLRYNLKYTVAQLIVYYALDLDENDQLRAVFLKVPLQQQQCRFTFLRHIYLLTSF